MPCYDNLSRMEKEVLIMKQSPRLTAFYNAYHDWLEAGAPIENSYEFSRHWGLCTSIIFCSNSKYCASAAEMTRQFKMAGLDKFYPFGENEYETGSSSDTQHLDKNRIAWVKAHLTNEVDEKFTLL